MDQPKKQMESFLPSEIARLVYGYLEEEECPKAAQAFLESSSHLKECLAASKNGRKFNTRMNGLCLVDVLDLLSEAITFVKDHSKEFKEDKRRDYRLLNTIQIDNFPNNFPPGCILAKRNNPYPSMVQSSCPYFQNFPTREDLYLTQLPGEPYEEMQATTQFREIPNLGERVVPGRGLIRVKQESDGEGTCTEDTEASSSEEVGEMIVPNIEPEVEIKLSAGKLARTEPAPVNLVPGHPFVVSGQQVLCQPYNMLQMLPGPYPASSCARPTVPTVYIPQCTQPSTSSCPLSSMYETAVRASTSSTVQTVWSKPKGASAQPKQNGSAKLRPIAPKITQALENGVKLQVVHTKENPLVEPNPTVSKRNLRSRKKPVRKIPSKNHSSSNMVIDDEQA